MVKTKTTPRMEGHRCPMWNGRIANEGEWENHVVECKKKRRQKKFECECADCDYATNKKSDIGRNRCTRHNETVSVNAGSGTSVLGQLDPGNMLDVVTRSSTSQQPLVDEVVEKKPTRLTPVCAPTMKPKVFQDPLTPRAPSLFRHPMTKKTLIHWNGFISNTRCQYTDTASNCRC